LTAGATLFVDPVWVFLERRGFAAKTQVLGVGFPWILSSESIDINGLHEIFRAKFFLAPFVGAKEPSERPPTICHEKRMDRSWGKLTSVSDFRQEIAARAASFGRLHPKANRSSSIASCRESLPSPRPWRASALPAGPIA
jgi:hypothetical protein